MIERCKALWKKKTTYPIVLFSIICLFLNADQNLIAPNLTQIQLEFNFTDVEKDVYLGGQLSAGFFLIGGFCSILSGYYADTMNRKNAFVICVILGEMSCFCTLFVTNYAGLFVTRAFSGISIGASLPLVYSMLGDMFIEEERGRAIAFFQIMSSLGIALGQTIAGLAGPIDALGWRMPFVIVSVPTFVLAPLFYFTTRDPVRGQMEKNADANAPRLGETMTWMKLKMLLRNKTALIAFVQGVPGSLPWGVMMVFFQDFLVIDLGPSIGGGITVQESTLVVTTFGAGAGLGLVLGGFLTDRFWKQRYEYVPLMMALSTCLGALPIYGLVNGPALSAYWLYALLTFPSGLLASITGTAIRTVLMNVTLPETRGSAFALHTLFDDLGKGLGPLWVGYIIAGFNGMRIPSFNIALGGWFICSLLLLAMVFTVRKDASIKEEQEKLQRQEAAVVDTFTAVVEPPDGVHPSLKVQDE